MRYRFLILRPFFTAALMVGMVFAWILFAPTQFGGSASYVIIAGASMEPSLQGGDVVLAQQSRTYRVGDVVTYSHPYVGPVIHRIIEVDGPSFVLQGDNNDWVDSYQPTREEILGKSWIIFPGAAKWLQQLRSPIGLSLLSISLGIMVLATVTKSKERIYSDQMKDNRDAAAIKSFSEIREGWLFPLLAILLGGILLGIFAFSSPILETITVEVPYQHRGEFSYHADAAPSVYDHGTIENGDAIFHSVVRKIDVAFQYDFSAPTLTQINGEYQLFLEVSEPNGWHRRIQLVPTTSFHQNNVLMSSTVDITRVQWLIGHLRERTNFNRAAFDVRIVPMIHLNANIAGQKVQELFSPALHFKLDEYQLFLDGTTPFAESEDPFNPMQVGMIEKSQQVLASLNILGADIQVQTARLIAGGMVVTALIGLAYVLFPVIQTWQQGESSRIALQFREILLDVEKLPKTKAAQTIKVSNFSDLSKLARSLNTLILHEVKDGKHTYLLTSNDVVYRYEFQDESEETNG